MKKNALFSCAAALLLSCACLRAEPAWQEEFSRMPLPQPVAQLNQSNCVRLLLSSFRRNAAVKGLVFMPGATDEFYFFHRARAVLVQRCPTLLDAVSALTNQTYIRATLRPPFLLLHTAEDPLEPIEVIEDPRTAERVKHKKFETFALYNDRHWDYLHPILSFGLSAKILPGLHSYSTRHFYRHSFAAFSLNGWEALEAVAFAGKTRFTVKKKKIVFDADTRRMGSVPLPDDFLLRRPWR